MSKELTPEQRAKRAAYARRYYQDHKIEIGMRSKKYAQGHAAERAAYKKQYYRDHETEIAAYGKQYYQENRGGAITRVRRYRQNHKAETAERKKQYFQEHKLASATYKRERRVNDVDYKLRYNLGNKIRQSIRGNKEHKHSADLLGCTIFEVREHLEGQFQPGMTWNNWSLRGWHIDHIIPLGSFDLTDPEQQRRAFHYTNLQPLWAADNIRKSNKIEERQLVLL